MRGDSFPESDDQRQIPESNQSIRSVGHAQQHKGVDGLGNCSENRSEAAQNGNSCVVPINSNPGMTQKERKGAIRIVSSCEFVRC